MTGKAVNGWGGTRSCGVCLMGAGWEASLQFRKYYVDKQVEITSRQWNMWLWNPEGSSGPEILNSIGAEMTFELC